MKKIKELDNWVESYNQPPDPKTYPAIKPNNVLKKKEVVSKNTGVRQNETKYNSVKPKNVYVVIIQSADRMQISGCFYSKADALKYAGVSANVVVQKLSVI
jgi:hypothetical protein